MQQKFKEVKIDSINKKQKQQQTTCWLLQNQPVPDSNETTPSRQRTTLRSSATVYDKNLCIICQKEGGKLHKVYYKSTGEKMLTIAKNLTDRSFFLRLNSIPNASDAVANDVQCHHMCWVLVQRNINDEENVLVQDTDDVNRVLAVIEIINMVQNCLHESPDTVIDMKRVKKIYQEWFLYEH